VGGLAMSFESYYRCRGIEKNTGKQLRDLFKEYMVSDYYCELFTEKDLIFLASKEIENE
jgi:hypothetical protein